MNQQRDEIVIALAGNPNTGKTTLFNKLTGLRQKVANYPGVTVEKKEADWSGEESIRLVDIPGLYSLDATSSDEKIAREALLGTLSGSIPPDCVVVTVDSTNLERGLYLVTQLIDEELRVVIALTMTDALPGGKDSIDSKKFEELLGVPVVPISARKSEGLDGLRQRVIACVNSGESQTRRIPDFAAGKKGVFERYKFIGDVFEEVTDEDSALNEETRSEKIDQIITHRFLGPVILIAILLLVFQTIFSWSSLPMDLLDGGFGSIGLFLESNLPDGVIRDLIVDGVVAGVGGVLIFLPQILLLFFFISILEESGYMARAAFILDKLMSKFGLHGKAFLPLMSSFACAIPGIMATRTIENKRDRIATIMIAPFMSCSARLPVYALMIGTFFAGQTVLGFVSLGAVLMLAMYLLGAFVAVIAAFFLKKTILKAPPPPFVMELPPYRIPNLGLIVRNMFGRSWLFLKRAGTVILVASIILWALLYFPMARSDSSESRLENSYAAAIGKTIEPAIAPLGFDWRIGVGLVASFAAREVLVSTLSVIYRVGEEADEKSPDLIKAIKDSERPDGSKVWTPLTGLSLMVFFVLAMQCMSTLAVVRRETNSWGWVLFMFGYMTLLAYIASLITYQGGKLFGFE